MCRYMDVGTSDSDDGVQDGYRTVDAGYLTVDSGSDQQGYLSVAEESSDDLSSAPQRVYTNGFIPEFTPQRTVSRVSVSL